MSKNQLEVVIVEENGSVAMLKPPKIITEEEFKKLCAKITIEKEFEEKENFGTLFVMKMANILIKEYNFTPVKVIASFPSNPVFYPPEDKTVVKFI